MMDSENILALLKRHSLFQDLNKEELSFIVSILEERSYLKDTFVFKEGEEENGLYLITQGEVEVLKKDPDSEEIHRISTLGAGDVFGEMALLTEAPRSASIRALSDIKTFIFPFTQAALHTEQKAVCVRIFLNLARTLSKRLREASEVTVSTLKKSFKGERIRAEVGRFLFSVLIFLSAWIFWIDLSRKFFSYIETSSVVSFSLILILSLIIVTHIKIAHYPLSFYGLTLKNWKKNLVEGVLFTLPILAVCTLIKWWMIQHYRLDMPLASFGEVNLNASLSPRIQTFIPYIYVLLTPLQEFIARGGFQSSVCAALVSSRNVFWSIILSNLVFSAFHNFISVYYAIAAFLGGLFWGWLYARQKSLVGPVVSHALIGWWVIWFLGIGSFLTNFPGFSHHL